MILFAKIVVRQCANHIAITDLISMTMARDAVQFDLELFQSSNLLSDSSQLISCDLIGIGTGSFRMLAKVDKLSYRFDRKAEFPGMPYERKAVQFSPRITTLVSF